MILVGNITNVYLMELWSKGYTIDLDWIPYDKLPAISISNQPVKSKTTDDKYKNSGYPTKTSSILFLVKTGQLLAIYFVFLALYAINDLVHHFTRFSFIKKACIKIRKFMISLLVM